MIRDIRLAINFLDHFKTIKLKRKLGWEGIESLMRLWFFSAQCNKADGVLSNMDQEDIEIAAKWGGKSGQLVDTLVDLGWLDYADNVFILHDWIKHQPHVLKDFLRTEDPLPYDWNRRRYEVFLRDDFICQYCGTKVERPHCDHIIPRSRGGSDKKENLSTACPSCNLKKSNKTIQEWLQ